MIDLINEYFNLNKNKNILLKLENPNKEQLEELFKIDYQIKIIFDQLIKLKNLLENEKSSEIENKQNPEIKNEKSSEIEKINLYYISGHSEPRFDTEKINKYRYQVPEKICIYTLVETGYSLEQKMFQLFNLGLNDNTSNELKKISFDKRNNLDINVELNLLEKNIYINGLYKSFKIDKVNDFISKKYPIWYIMGNGITVNGMSYNNINSAIIFYLLYNNIMLDYDSYFNVMNMPVKNIITFILEKLEIDKDKKYTLEELITLFYKDFKVQNESSFRKSTMLSDLILKFINNVKTELLDESITYFNLLKKIYNLSLRRYFENQTIYDYRISINLNGIRGLLAAPYPVEKEHSELELNLYDDFRWNNNIKSLALSTIIDSFINNPIKIKEKILKEYNVFILGICNVINGIKVIHHNDDDYIINTVPEETEDLKLARENSLRNYFSKYLKYKNKYIKYKNKQLTN